MSRTVLVGDVHGCRAELEDLLSHVGLNADDRLILVGDLVVRGPEPRATLELVRAVGGTAVRGNHEDRLLRWNARRKTAKPLRIGPTTRKTASELRDGDWKQLAEMPLWLDLPAHGIRVVHAGIVPGIPILEQDPRTLMYVRTLGPSREPLEERGRSWAHSHTGPEHVVYGHNAQAEPEIARFATGIDTGAVYGGRLTAMVLRDGERVPPPRDRQSVLVSVPAHRAYFVR